MRINFDSYRYYPSLRSRLWEMRGYSNLQQEDKEKIAPILVMAAHHGIKAAVAIGEKIEEYVEGRPYIIDIEQSPIYACDEAEALCNPDNAFEAWRMFATSLPNAVPTALLPNSASIRSVVRQVLALEQVDGNVVVRSRSPSDDLPILTAILSAVDSVDNILIVLDFGYMRSRAKAVAVEAANVINALRDADAGARIVFLGSSFPRSAATYDDAGAMIPIEERSIHLQLGGDRTSIYGDYGSIHPEPVEPMQSRFVPRIDYPLPENWIFRRVRSDRGGYQSCAEQIVQLPDWDSDLADRNWGAQKIKAASEGDLTSMGSPAPWIAVRVNLHLWQQIHYGDDAASLDDDLGLFG